MDAPKMRLRPRRIRQDLRSSSCVCKQAAMFSISSNGSLRKQSGVVGNQGLWSVKRSPGWLVASCEELLNAGIMTRVLIHVFSSWRFPINCMQPVTAVQAPILMLPKASIILGIRQLNRVKNVPQSVQRYWHALVAFS